MVASILSPCHNCSKVLPGIPCSPRHRSRCVIFLDYIRVLHRMKAHGILVNELRNLLVK